MTTLKSNRTEPLSQGRCFGYSQCGAMDSPEVLLCLPGLLETRESFAPLLKAAGEISGLRVVSLDYCGRGDSDPLTNDSGYCMSLYLADTLEFVQREIYRKDLPRPRLQVLGTSMGGILGMYLAAQEDAAVRGLFLNDIALGLTWMSIYGLYDGMKRAGRTPSTQQIAVQLGVTEGAVRDVQSSHHFDLAHHKDWTGMQFGHMLQRFKGAVRLVYGSESGVCLPQQVQELQQVFPKARLLRVEGAAHPVAFTQEVCAFVLDGFYRVPASPPTVALPVFEASTQIQVVEEAQVVEDVPKKRPSWWSRLLWQVATKK